ncbi:unnamed protein product [Durusdinium trenchii]|uniref:Uncharacterized protein n=1 Tax=Durusdinium trenchii TaxID=1381693 RepID=A0ABP0PTG2_9DINO
MWPHGLLLTLLPRLSGSSGAGSASASAALQTWAAKGQVERLPMLLEAGADDLAGITALHLASRNGHLAMVDALLAQRAEVNVADLEGVTPLHWAAQQGHSEVVMALLKAGAFEAFVRGVPCAASPLHWAAAASPAALRWLLLAGFQVDALDVDGLTPLMWACWAGQTEPRVVRVWSGLVGVGAVGENGGMVQESVENLLASGASVHHVDGAHQTALHWAARGDDPEVVYVLLAFGADPEVQERWIRCEVDPLVIASSTGGARRDGGLEIAGKEWMPSWRGRSDGSDGRGKKEMLSLLVFGGEAAAAAVQLYHVGQKVRQWFDTKIKAVNVNSQGQLLSYDLSGKPRAAPEKIRPQKRFAKAAATVKSGAAKAAAEAKGEAAAVAQAHEVQAQVAPEAPNGAQTQAAKDQTPRTSTAKFQVGQQVFYLSGQLNQYLPAEVTRLLRTPSGAAWAEGWVTDGGAGGKSGGLTWFWFVLSVVWAGYGRVHDLLSHGFLGRILTTAQASKAHHEAQSGTEFGARDTCAESTKELGGLSEAEKKKRIMEKRHVLEEELALLRRQLEERPLRQEVVAAPSAVPEDLQAQLVQLQAERQQLEAECARRTAQKEELVLQLEEALAKSESVQLKELQQSLDEAEAAQQRLSQQWSSAKEQLQHAKAEGDMLTSELQKLGQQLQDSQAQTEALQRECDELRARYNNLEADHSDLNLRAEEALAGHEALTAEHQRVIEQAKQLQSRQGLEDEGLRKTHQALEAELLKVQAERDILAKQVKDQELYTAARQEDLKADAERLRDENLARADEWKAIVSELADLRSSRAALDTKCAELIDKAADASEECQKQRGLAESFRSESETLKGELQQLQKAVLDAASQQQITAEEAERLRNEAAELEATRRALQREVDEYRRQMETSSVERGASEAELARLEACAEALAEENHQLRSRIDTLAPKDAEEAYAAAIISAEQWVLYHAGMPLEGTSMPYLSGVTISFAEFYAPLLSLVFASPPQQLRSAAAAVESGELARASLQCFRLCDAQRVGRLTWEEVQDLSDAVFQRKGLPTPSQDVQYLMFTKFDKECASRLHAQDCLCWVDALFRAMLMSPAAVAARVSEAPEGPIVSGPRSGAAPAPSEARLLQESVAQGRLQKTLGRGT